LKAACEAQLPGCYGMAEHAHHRKLRSQGGSGEETIDVCLHCHAEIHSFPARSFACGLLVHSWEDPAEIPVDASSWWRLVRSGA
jgi:hypothetical protein